MGLFTISLEYNLFRFTRQPDNSVLVRMYFFPYAPSMDTKPEPQKYPSIRFQQQNFCVKLSVQNNMLYFNFGALQDVINYTEDEMNNLPQLYDIYTNG